MKDEVRIALSDSDLRYVVEAVATDRDDHDRVVEIVRDKPDMIDVMLGDDKLFRKLSEDEEAFVKVSPWLFFSALVRRAIKDLAVQSFTIERVGTTERIPVFDADRVSALMKDASLRDYLIDMLVSFVRTESTTVWYRSGPRYRKLKYSDFDVDDMIGLAGDIDNEFRFPLYKRIGDICLFTVGVMPEHVLAGHIPSLSLRATMRSGRSRRSLSDYETEARRFYRLASTHPRAKQAKLDNVLARLAGNFELARKPLNLMSDRYIRFQKTRIFGQAD